MKFASTLLSAVFVLCVLVLVAGSSMAIALVKREAAQLPPTAGMLDVRPAQISRILASNGDVMGEFAQENRLPVALDAVPSIVQQAFVSAEDRGFWHHHGIDPAAIVRAALTDLRMRGSGRRPIGASTITQQVVKNLLNGDEHSLRRKVREALLAMRLDKEMGKRRILELYLNQIYLGYGAYGVAAAAQTYFGKPLAELDLAESAYLAGLPKGPANYDPLRRPDAALARRSYVLGRMLEDGDITPEQAASARMQALPQPVAKVMSGVAEDYFAEEARREIVASMGSSQLYRGGVVVHTSMDPRLQALAQRSLRQGLEDYDRRHGWRGAQDHMAVGNTADPALWRPALEAIAPPAGAEDWRQAVVLGSLRDGGVRLGFLDGTTQDMGLDGVRWARSETLHGLGPLPRRVQDVLSTGDVVLVSAGSDNRLQLRQIPLVQGALVAMEVRTGRVLAVSGGFSHEQGSFDRATQSLRQPGSTFKPFIYLTAFQQGFDATSPILDSPVSIDPGGGAPLWRPGADGGAGWGLITARRALENSRNLAAVRLIYDLGLDAVGKTARDFGLYPSLPSYAAALGALEVTDLRMTTAYAMIANGGHTLQPTFIDSVSAPDGTLLARRDQTPMTAQTLVADPVAVAQMTSVLEGVVRHGTAAAELAHIDLPIAGKTGTTNDNVDAWFVGYSPDIAVGVHVGYDRPEPLGGTEFGGLAAAPVFGQFIQGALALYPPSQASFAIPPGAHLAHVDPMTGQESRLGSPEVVRNAPGEDTGLSTVPALEDPLVHGAPPPAVTQHGGVTRAPARVPTAQPPAVPHDANRVEVEP